MARLSQRERDEIIAAYRAGGNSADIGRKYGVNTVLIPALGARLTINGRQAMGSPWKREREGRPFSTCALAFSESWTEPR